MKSKDPKRELPFDKEEIIQKIAEIADEGTVYEDMYISRKTFINLLWASSKGVYTFVGFDDKDEADLLIQAMEIKKYFSVPADGLFMFFLSESASYLVERNMKALKEVEDPMKSFGTICRNLSTPSLNAGYVNKWSLDFLLQEHDTEKESEENDINGMVYEHEGVMFQIQEEEEDLSETPEYIKPVVDLYTLSALDTICQKITGNVFPDADYRIDADGNEYVLKDGDIMVKGFNTGLIGKKKWYRVSDKDPVTAFLMTVFGGWFGLHRLATGNLVSFAFYLISCGCFGVFYIIDVLLWLIGSPSYSEVNYYEHDDGLSKRTRLIREKNKVYYKKLPNKLMALGGLIASVVIFLLVFNLVYKNAYSAILTTISSSAHNIDASQIVEGMSGSDISDIVGK